MPLVTEQEAARFTLEALGSRQKSYQQVVSAENAEAIFRSPIGREFLRILESEVEPAIKELSSCLLMPDTSTTELDQCVDKFQAALNAMKNAQSNLQSNLEKVRNLGVKLLKS